VFKFFLVDERGDVHDPAGFLTAVPNWSVGETFSIGSGESFRILEIKTEIAGRAPRRRPRRRVRRRTGLIYRRVSGSVGV
jgi:hypothetical protein